MKKAVLRRKRIVALLLATSLVFTMNVTLSAEELYDDYESSELTLDSCEDSVGEIQDTEEITAEIDEKEITTDAGKGWICETADKTVVKNKFEDNSEGVIAILSTNHTERILPDNVVINERGEKIVYDYTTGKDAVAKYYGTLGSKDLGIVPENDIYLDKINKYGNSITISVSKGEIEPNDEDDGKLLVQIRSREESVENTNPEAKFCLRKSGINGYIVHFELEEGLKIYGHMEGEITTWEIYSEETQMYHNSPCAPSEVKLDNVTISYNTKIPYYGKSNKFALDAAGDITVVDNQTGEIYEVEKIKIVKLKNGPKNQGPFPTVSNAGIQIKKLKIKNESKKKETKRLAKALKKATKVTKSQPLSAVKLPVIIYPLRLIEGSQKATVGGHTVSDKVIKGKNSGGKNKLSFQFKIGGKKVKIKNGKKDSFKTGTHEITFDKEKKILSINSADVWTGYKGLSGNHIVNKTK